MVWNFVIQIVASLVLTAISYVLAPKPKTSPPKAAGLDDFDLPTAEEGRPISVVFGTAQEAQFLLLVQELGHAQADAEPEADPDAGREPGRRGHSDRPRCHLPGRLRRLAG